MCAAPGSKTTQILEVITLGKDYCDDIEFNNKKNNEENNMIPGYVIANDTNTSRAYMLVHQCRRLLSPYLMVTTHQAQQFPTVYLNSNNKDKHYFDRVLCDVPCSGDGTMRKNPEIWSKWSIKGSLSLHCLQLSIAQRGLQLLKEDGIMVYSTCSMSPYGNTFIFLY